MPGKLQKVKDFAASMDPTGFLLEKVSKVKPVASSRNVLKPSEEGHMSGGDTATDDMMNRQSKIRKTFGKIPGKN